LTSQQINTHHSRFLLLGRNGGRGLISHGGGAAGDPEKPGGRSCSTMTWPGSQYQSNKTSPN